MKAVIQRVLESSVAVDGSVVGQSGKGYMILLGVMKGDTEKHADLLARKVSSLRVFEDETLDVTQQQATTWTVILTALIPGVNGTDLIRSLRSSL